MCVCVCVRERERERGRTTKIVYNTVGKSFFFLEKKHELMVESSSTMLTDGIHRYTATHGKVERSDE